MVEDRSTQDPLVLLHVISRVVFPDEQCEDRGSSYIHTESVLCGVIDALITLNEALKKRIETI